MTAKIKEILTLLEGMVHFEPDNKMSDEEFIANIDAINLLCNIRDEVGLDRKEIRRKMTSLYPEFSRRIYGKKDIRQSIELIKALYRYIYGRGYDEEDRGPKAWRNSLIEICCKVVYQYRRQPSAPTPDYLYCLITSARLSLNPALSVPSCNAMQAGGNPVNTGNNPMLAKVREEYQKAMRDYLADISTVTDGEKLRRIAAMQDAADLFKIDDYDRWQSAIDSLEGIDIKQLNDSDLLLWIDLTDGAPLRELKKRGKTSPRLLVEYLATKTWKSLPR